MTHFSHDYEQGIKDERERILKIMDEHKLLPTYSKAASEFLEEAWDNIKWRLGQEIKGEPNE
jgi:hypothetical protein